jgi:hypothetical protein
MHSSSAFRVLVFLVEFGTEQVRLRMSLDTRRCSSATRQLDPYSHRHYRPSELLDPRD